MEYTAPASAPAERRGASIVMACLGVFISYLPITTVAVSLPAIQRALGASTAQLSWVQDAFVLPMAALILTAGVVGDVHGRKKVYQAGLVFAAAGAVLALCAHSIGLLWAGQALSGLGSAALLPTTLALISHAVPNPRERGKFIGLWAMALLAALAIGPVIAGVLLQHVTWRWIYLPTIPAALAVLAASVPLLTDSRAPHGRRLDWPGQITAALAITALVYGVIEGGAGSFTQSKVLAALGVAAVSLAGFIVVELRSGSPMLNLRLLRVPAFTATALIAMITFLALIGFFFVLSLYFGMVQQLTTLQAGSRLLLVPVAAIIAGVPAGRLMHVISPRAMITGGLVLIGGSMLALTTLDATTSFAAVSWKLIILGLGMGAVTTPMTAAAVASVPHHLAGMAAAANNAFRQVGGALGPALLGALLTTRALHTLPAHLAATGLTAAQQHEVTATAHTGGLAALATMNLGGAATGQMYTALSAALIDGLHLCLIIATILTGLATLCALVLLRRPRQRPGDAPAAAQRSAHTAGAPQHTHR